MPRPPETVRRLRTEIHHVVLEGHELAVLRLELSHAVSQRILARAA